MWKCFQKVRGWQYVTFSLLSKFIYPYTGNSKPIFIAECAIYYQYKHFMKVWYIMSSIFCLVQVFFLKVCARQIISNCSCIRKVVEQIEIHPAARDSIVCSPINIWIVFLLFVFQREWKWNSQ